MTVQRDRIDQDGQIAWVAEHADLPESIVGQVLSLELDYMVAVGIAECEGYTPRFYTNDEDLPQVVDTKRLAQDAEVKLGIDAATAQRVYLAELSFLLMRGFA